MPEALYEKFAPKDRMNYSGTWVFHDIDGSRIEGDYKKGVPQGYWRKTSPGGRLVCIDDFSVNGEWTRTRYFPDASVRSIAKGKTNYKKRPNTVKLYRLEFFERQWLGLGEGIMRLSSKGSYGTQKLKLGETGVYCEKEWMLPDDNTFVFWAYIYSTEGNADFKEIKIVADGKYDAAAKKIVSASVRSNSASFTMEISFAGDSLEAKIFHDGKLLNADKSPRLNQQ